MTLQKIATTLFLSSIIISCTQMDRQTHLDRIQNLSERTGIEMIVIDEAEKITDVEATRFLRGITLSSFIDDPIQSSIRQGNPRQNTVELPGISFLIDSNDVESLVDSLNKKFAYRRCMAFISDNSTRNDKKQTISLINTFDKFNALRLQETSGGSYIFSTDSLIDKLKKFETKYPFKFIGVGDDWLLIQTINTPKDWVDFSNEVMKICPVDDELTTDELSLKSDNGRVYMWWD